MPGPAPEPKQTRFYGSVVLDPDQYNRQIAKINEMIIDQLRFSHATLELRLEIQATQPDGFDPSIVKRVSDSAETPASPPAASTRSKRGIAVGFRRTESPEPHSPPLSPLSPLTM